MVCVVGKQLFKFYFMVDVIHHEIVRMLHKGLFKVFARGDYMLYFTKYLFTEC